jgi:hypothetical protein
VVGPECDEPLDEWPVRGDARGQRSEDLGGAKLDQPLPGFAAFPFVSLAQCSESTNGLADRSRGGTFGSGNRWRASVELRAQPSPAIRDPRSLAAASAEPESIECAKRLVHDGPSGVECGPVLSWLVR